MSLDNNSHSVFLFDSGYEIWQKDAGRYDIGTDAVAERHLGQRFRHTAEADGIARNDLAGLDSRTYEIEIPLQRPGIGHMVFERGMTH